MINESLPISELSKRNIMWTTNLSHICDFKYLNSHVLKSKKKVGEINFNNFLPSISNMLLFRNEINIKNIEVLFSFFYTNSKSSKSGLQEK